MRCSNNSAGLYIIEQGPLSLLQSEGRQHLQYLGLSEGGACDRHAYFWANYLLGNAKNCAAIEVTLGPFEAEFTADTIIAICGADLHCTLNNKVLLNWSTHRVVSGDRIKMLPNNNGLRAYLAVKNGFNTAKAFGFSTEVPRENLSEKTVINNALLKYESFSDFKWIGKQVPSRFIKRYQTDLVLRVIPSYQYHLFSSNSLKTFLENDYRISPRSDRMGYRLQGEAIAWSGGGIISEGIAYGSIQIPPDGQPIILLNDRQTIGGYPKLGCVAAEDCFQLAQRHAGQKLRFEFVQSIQQITPLFLPEC